MSNNLKGKWGIPIDHNSQDGLQGGNITERFHLSSAEYSDLATSNKFKNDDTTVTIFDDFITTTIGMDSGLSTSFESKDITWIIQNGAFDVSIYDAGHPGIIQLTSGSIISFLGSGGFYQGFSSEYSPSVKFIAKAINSNGFFFSLTRGGGISNPGVWFSGTGVNWTAVAQNTAAESVDTGVAVDTNWHKFEITFSLADIKYYIDSILVATITTQIPPYSIMMRPEFNGDFQLDCVYLSQSGMPSRI